MKKLLGLTGLMLLLSSCGYSASVGYASSAPATSSAPCHFHYSNGQPLPDPTCTPGAIQSSDTAAICTPGWASDHRQSFTKAERIAAFARYGIDTTDPASVGEYDHLIPLELGGANTPDNLWPEVGSIPNPKDAVENQLHSDVCSGKVALASAQQAIAKNWTTAEQVTGG